MTDYNIFFYYDSESARFIGNIFKLAWTWPKVNEEDVGNAPVSDMV